MRFEGRVVIVMGAAGAIGRAAAERFAREGARVLLADVSPAGEAVAAALRERGAEAVFRRTDVAVDADVAAAVADATGRWGRLDVMVANAGIPGRGRVDEAEPAAWARVLDVNLTGVFHCLRHAVGAMRPHGGAIVTVASVMGLVATRGAAAYVAAKAGVVNLTRAAALDHAAENIRVNAVCPGFLEGPTMGGGAARSPAETAALVARHPLGRLGRAEDVAAAIAFLASSEAEFVTGACLPVDGGYTAQ